MEVIYTTIPIKSGIAFALVAALAFTSCTERAANAQAQLQRAAVPAATIVKGQELSAQNLAMQRAVASPTAIVDPAAAGLSLSYSDARWLSIVNDWRFEAGAAV